MRLSAAMNTAVIGDLPGSSRNRLQGSIPKEAKSSVRAMPALDRRSVQDLDGSLQPPQSDCILLYGAFANGNLGDVIQAVVMEELLLSVDPNLCFWYAHPYKEEGGPYRIGEFFGKDPSRLIPLSSTSAPEVNRFRALVIGGGGIFVAKHIPLYMEDFAQEVNIPVVILGVGASDMAKYDQFLINKAVFVSGRDDVSVTALSKVLRIAEDPVVSPDDVQLVRDPVLSDKMLSDTDGKCWQQSKGDVPLCFVLPAGDKDPLKMLHHHLVSGVVREGDVFVNVFPKHHEELLPLGYPEEIDIILEPKIFMERLCSCRAIISSRLHGAILGLHMGVPTFGAWHQEDANKVPDLMMDVMHLPDQFVLVNENLTRADLEAQVESVRLDYWEGDRRSHIHGLLASFYDDFEEHTRHVLTEAVGLNLSTPAPVIETQTSGLKDEMESNMEPGAAQNMHGLVMSIILIAFIVGMTVRRQRSVEKTQVNKGVASQRRSTGEEEVQKEIALLTPQQKSPSSQEGTGAPSVSPRTSRMVLALDFLVWVSLAVGFSMYGKGYLRETRDPAGLLVLQGLTGVVVLGGLGHWGFLDLDPVKELQKAVRASSGLAAVLHTSQAFLTNIAVLVGGVAVTNAVKAMEPVAAAVFSYFLLGKQLSRAKLAGVLTIVAGITLLTSKHSGSHNTSSSRAALLTSTAITIGAVCCNALRNVVLKRGVPIPPHVILYVCSAAATLVGVILTILTLILSMSNDKHNELGARLLASWFQSSGFNASLCFLGYNFASFNILAYLNPVGHAVGNSCKRMLVFASGLILLGEVMSLRQFSGAVLALSGVLVYNIAGARR